MLLQYMIIWVIDIKEIALRHGSVENLHASGCSDFSVEAGVSLLLTIFSESSKMEIVFDTVAEAQRFCLLLGYVAVVSNITVNLRHLLSNISSF